MVGDLAILFLSPTFADCNQIYVLLADDQLHERQSSLPVWPTALITSLTPPVNLACRRNLSKESNPIQQITLSQKSGLWISACTCGIELKAVVLLQLHKQLKPNHSSPKRQCSYIFCCWRGGHPESRIVVTDLGGLAAGPGWSPNKATITAQHGNPLPLWSKSSSW